MYRRSYIMAIAGAGAIGAIGAIGGAVSAVQGLTNTLGLTNIASAVRAVDLPSAGEVAGDLYTAVAAFAGDSAAGDWRVRLSLPTWPSFATSAVFKPLKDAGGMIFPYTPQIQLQSTATYTSMKTTHTNHNFYAYQHSDPGTITITAPMNVEDAQQGLYWIASMHYLRSLTKMFTGNDPKAGNPPPVVFLNAYGQYVFANVPVVVTNFSAILDNKCDYISVPVVGSAAGIVQGLSDATAVASNSLAGVFGKNDVTDFISGAANVVSDVSALAGLFGVGGAADGGMTHVPTKSTFTITLQTMYSRNSVRTFSLDRFVEGGYLNSGFGWV